jgi:hypothetical protein
MSELKKADTIEEVDAANAALMEAMQNLMGIVDPEQLMAGGGGRTWGEYLDMMMGLASDSAATTLDAIEDEVQAAYEDMVDRVTAANDALMEFTDSLDAASQGPGGGGDGGYYDLDTGEWVPRKDSGENYYPGGAPVNVNQMMNVNLVAEIDGEPLYGLVRGMVQDQLDDYGSWVLEVTGGKPVID